MICSVKQSGAAVSATELFRQQNPSRVSKPRLSLLLRAMPTAKTMNNNSVLSSRKPLYISSVESFGSSKTTSNPKKEVSFECKAYEADRSQPIELPDQETRTAAAQKVKISIYFATWWALNVVFNIYNKKLQNTIDFEVRSLFLPARTYFGGP